MACFVAKISEFKDDDILDEGEYAIDVTDVSKGGIVEIGFDVMPKSNRVYLRFRLHELVRIAMDRRTEDDE